MLVLDAALSEWPFMLSFADPFTAGSSTSIGTINPAIVVFQTVVYLYDR